MWGWGDRAYTHTHASPTEYTRPAGHESAPRRRRKRDLTPRIPLRCAQSESPSPSALPGPTSTQHFRPLHPADDGQKQVHGHWPRARCDWRIWAVSSTSLDSWGLKCGVVTGTCCPVVPVPTKGTRWRAAWHSQGILVEWTGPILGTCQRRTVLTISLVLMARHQGSTNIYPENV